MGLFTKLVGDIAKTVGGTLEEAKCEAKKNFHAAREEVRKNYQEEKQEVLNTVNDKKAENQLGTFEDGVLTIIEGHTALAGYALEGYENIRKVIFLIKEKNDFFL